MVRDAQGNMYVAGRFEGGLDADPGPGEHILVSASNVDGGFSQDAFVAKYAASGEFVWAKSLFLEFDPCRFRAPVLNAITVDADGNVYAVGAFQEGEAGVEGLVVKLTSSGQLAWTRRYAALGVFVQRQPKS